MFFGDYFNYFLYYILAILVILVLVVWIIVRVILHFVRGGKSRNKEIGSKNWYLQMSLSREDAVSQLYFFLALGFLGITLFTFNRNLGQPFEWYTILLVTCIAGMVTAYYFKVIYALAFSLMGIIVWWVAQASNWATAKDIQTSAIFATVAWLALLMVVVGTLHEIKPLYKRAATVYEALGILVTAGIFFFLSSNMGLETFQSFLNGKPFYSSWQLSISLLVIFAILGFAVIYAYGKKLLHGQEAITIALLSVVFMVVAFLPQLKIREAVNYYDYSSLSGGVGSLTAAGAFWAMVFNVMTLLGLLSVMLAGNLRRETWQINLGALLLFIYVFVKYFDWFYTFLDKSVFFIGAGILFFVIGFFMEWARKRVIQNIVSASSQVNV